MADYNLTAGDIATFPTLLQIQGDIGPGVIPLTQAGVWDLMAQLDVLAKQPYTSIHNGQLKAWVDGIFTPLITTTTVCQNVDGTHVSVIELYLFAAWGRWLPTASDYDPNSVIGFMNEFWRFIEPGGAEWWPWPNAPGNWHDAVQSLYLNWIDRDRPQRSLHQHAHDTTTTTTTTAGPSHHAARHHHTNTNTTTSTPPRTAPATGLPCRVRLDSSNEFAHTNPPRVVGRCDAVHRCHTVRTLTRDPTGAVRDTQ
jgi:hypothetical protein